MKHAWLFGWLIVAAGCDEPGGGSAPKLNVPVMEQSSPEPIPEAQPVLAAPPPSVEVPPSEEVRPVVTIVPSLSFDTPGGPSVTEVRRVEVHVDVIGAKGAHTVTVVFLTPSGATYQVFERAVKGAEHGAVGVDFELPVAGTVIDSLNLEGVWTAQVLFDGVEHARNTFQLSP